MTGETLHEMWAQAGFLGPGESYPPISWQELEAFGRLTGVVLSHEEWSTIQEMSCAYGSALRDTDPFSKSPVDKALEHE